jgi:nicotinate-nucleotide adenylyltransferase
MFVTAVRPGFDVSRLDALAGALSADQVDRLRRHVIPAPLIEVSSTLIRRRVAEGRPVRFLVPDAVAEYIADRRLYAPSAIVR